MTSRVHYWEIDVLKGLAILGVLAIHSELLGNSLFHQSVVDRSVYILLVLFGVSSETWWRRQPEGSAWQITRTYGWSRLLKLMPPVWCAVVCWWVIVHALPNVAIPPAWPWVPLHALGFMPQIGTAWFITLIVQLVLLFPLLHFGLERLRAWLFCAVCGVISVVSVLYALEIVGVTQRLLGNAVPQKGFFALYSFWIFAPGKFVLVCAGMMLAQSELRVRRSVAAACAVLFGVGLFVARTYVTDAQARNAVTLLLDVPLTITLLMAARYACPAACRSGLAWLGRGSWGIYLGQLVVHNALAGIWQRELGWDLAMRALYFLCLLIGGVAWVLAERAVGRLIARAQADRVSPSESMLRDPSVTR